MQKRTPEVWVCRPWVQHSWMVSNLVTAQTDIKCLSNHLCPSSFLDIFYTYTCNIVVYDICVQYTYVFVISYIYICTRCISTSIYLYMCIYIYVMLDMWYVCYMYICKYTCIQIHILYLCVSNIYIYI